MPARIAYDHAALAALCQRWGIARLECFGSVLRDDFRPDSDIDLLVTFAPGVQPGFEFFDLKDELERLFGRRVDLLSRKAVEASRNPYRRRGILLGAETLHAA